MTDFFSLTKRTLVIFVIFYIFLVLIIGIATGGFVLRQCPSCPPSVIETAGFYAMILGLSYILFCWIQRVWGKVQRMRRST